MVIMYHNVSWYTVNLVYIYVLNLAVQLSSSFSGIWLPIEENHTKTLKICAERKSWYNIVQIGSKMEENFTFSPFSGRYQLSLCWGLFLPCFLKSFRPEYLPLNLDLQNLLFFLFSHCPNCTSLMGHVFYMTIWWMGGRIS